MSVLDVAGVAFASEVPVLIVGAGAAGLCAALAAHEAGAECVRRRARRGAARLDGAVGRADPGGGHALSSASGASRMTLTLFAADILRKARNEPAPEIVDLVARGAAPLVEWLADAYGLHFSVVDDFDYPGHSARRMHGLPSRSGAELVDRLRDAVENAGIPIVTNATVTTLFAEADLRVRGVAVSRPDGSSDAIGCRSPGACLQRLWRKSRAHASATFPKCPRPFISAMREIAATLFFGARGSARSSPSCRAIRGMARWRIRTVSSSPGR